MRPDVDVVIPFHGPDTELIELCEHLALLPIRQGDSVVVVDNRPTAGIADRSLAGVPVVGAPGLQTSYHARNRGARRGHAPWLVFVDADVRVPPDLLDSYFDPEPEPTTGILAGEIGNEVVPDGDRRALAVRYAHLVELFAQRRTMEAGDFAYAMTANCAIRRTAFENVGGFIENIRSGGDADMCFRIARTGWRMETRDHAAVIHVNRPTIRKLLRQSARHGSGAAWLHRHYPGFSRPSRISGLLYRSFRTLLTAALARARGDSDSALLASVDVARSIAFEAGRRADNEVSPSLSRAAGN
jgi:GT2 family glycosyltransferase